MQPYFLTLDQVASTLSQIELDVGAEVGGTLSGSLSASASASASALGSPDSGNAPVEPVPLGLWVAVESLRRCAESETLECAEALLQEGLRRTELAPAHELGGDEGLRFEVVR